MGRFFRYDNPVMMGLGKVMDLITLSVLWLLCSIPVITIVPATAALYYVTLKIARKEEYRVVFGFFRAFRDNLKQGIGLSAVFMAAGALLYLDYRIMTLQGESLNSVLQTVFLLFAVITAAVMLYTFPLQAQFENRIFRTLKNAMLFSLMKLPNTLLLLLLHSIPVLVILVSPEIMAKTVPLWLILFPATAAYLSSLRFVKVVAPFMTAEKDADVES